MVSSEISPEKGTMTLLEHFRELRKRLFRAALGVLLGGGFGWVFYDYIVDALSKPK